MDRNIAVARVCGVVGTQEALAKLMSISQPTVSEWVQRGRPVPLERCIEMRRIAKEHGLEVALEDLNEQIDWQAISDAFV